MAITICVCNNKGGPGKTTSSVNIAHALAREKRNILLVDADPQSNATAKLLDDRIPPEQTLFAAFTNIEDNSNNSNSIIHYTKYERLWCIPNHIDLTSKELFMGSDLRSFWVLREILIPHSERFDYIIIDSPPNLGIFVVNSLIASDLLIVPVECGSTDSLEGLGNLFGLVSFIREKFNPSLRLYKILPTKIDKRTTASRIVLEMILEAYGKDKVFETNIPRSTIFQQAEAMRGSIFERDQNSYGARAYRAIAREIIKDLEES